MPGRYNSDENLSAGGKKESRAVMALNWHESKEMAISDDSNQRGAI